MEVIQSAFLPGPVVVSLEAMFVVLHCATLFCRQLVTWPLSYLFPFKVALPSRRPGCYTPSVSLSLSPMVGPICLQSSRFEGVVGVSDGADEETRLWKLIRLGRESSLPDVSWAV